MRIIRTSVFHAPHSGSHSSDGGELSAKKYRQQAKKKGQSAKTRAAGPSFADKVKVMQESDAIVEFTLKHYGSFEEFQNLNKEFFTRFASIKINNQRIIEYADSKTVSNLVGSGLRIMAENFTLLEKKTALLEKDARKVSDLKPAKPDEFLADLKLVNQDLFESTINAFERYRKAVPATKYVLPEVIQNFSKIL